MLKLQKQLEIFRVKCNNIREYLRNVIALIAICSFIPIAIFWPKPSIMNWIDDVAAKIDEWRLK